MNAMLDRTRSPWLHIPPLLLLLAAWGLSVYGGEIGIHPVLGAVCAGLLGTAGCILWGTALITLFRAHGISALYLTATFLFSAFSLLSILSVFPVFPWDLPIGWCFLVFAAVFGIAPLLMLLRVLPNRDLYPLLLSQSRYPVELTDRNGELILESSGSKPLSSAQRELLINGSQGDSLSLSPDWDVICTPIPNGFALVRRDLHDRNLLQHAQDEVEAEIARYRELLSNEITLQESLRMTKEESQALGVPISVLKEKEKAIRELLLQAEADDCSPMQRRRLLQNVGFTLVSALQYGVLIRSAKAGDIASPVYGSALEKVLQSLGGLGLSASLRNIAVKSYPASPLCSMFLTQCELLQTAVDSHWSDLNAVMRDDGSLLRIVFSMTGADSSQVSSWVREHNSALLSSGIKAGAGLEAGRCSIYFHVSGGEDNAPS